MMCLPSVLVSCLNGILSTVSQSAVAFFGVYYKLQTFVYMPSNGVVQGMRPLMSYNYGYQKRDRMDKILKTAGVCIFAILCAGTLLFTLLPEPILKMFSASDEMLVIGVSGLRILALGFVISSFSIVMCGALESLGFGHHSLVVSLLRQFIITIPGAMLVLPMFGLNGVWWMFPISELIAGIVAFIFYENTYKRIEV